ncbi:CLUMA_CG016057, isoform A [Clunio marinus]|uniref:CLUMA_CG016057, isoform A n=1 Tax=Clunio marinus TaxID=568069 RepID=A0A1J1IS25_9DIPT|nr:CLUMA_CG016057, isoform A [Clunio marinus]
MFCEAKTRLEMFNSAIFEDILDPVETCFTFYLIVSQKNARFRTICYDLYSVVALNAHKMSNLNKNDRKKKMFKASAQKSLRVCGVSQNDFFLQSTLNNS